MKPTIVLGISTADDADRPFRPRAPVSNCRRVAKISPQVALEPTASRSALRSAGRYGKRIAAANRASSAEWPSLIAARLGGISPGKV